MSLADMASKAGLTFNISSLGLLSRLKDMKTTDVNADVIADVCAAFKLSPSSAVISEVAEMIRNQPATALPDYLSKEEVFFPLMEKLTAKPASMLVAQVNAESETVPVICTCCQTEGQISRREALLAGKFVKFKCHVCNATRDILSRAVIQFGVETPQ